MQRATSMFISLLPLAKSWDSFTLVLTLAIVSPSPRAPYDRRMHAGTYWHRNHRLPQTGPTALQPPPPHAPEDFFIMKDSETSQHTFVAFFFWVICNLLTAKSGMSKICWPWSSMAASRLVKKAKRQRLLAAQMSQLKTDLLQTSKSRAWPQFWPNSDVLKHTSFPRFDEIDLNRLSYSRESSGCYFRIPKAASLW